MLWNKRKVKLSKICIDEAGNIVDPDDVDNFTVKDLIQLLKSGAVFIDSLVQLEKSKKDNKK